MGKAWMAVLIIIFGKFGLSRRAARVPPATVIGQIDGRHAACVFYAHVQIPQATAELANRAAAGSRLAPTSGPLDVANGSVRQKGLASDCCSPMAAKIEP